MPAGVKIPVPDWRQQRRPLHQPAVGFIDPLCTKTVHLVLTATPRQTEDPILSVVLVTYEAVIRSPKCNHSLCHIPQPLTHFLLTTA